MKFQPALILGALLTSSAIAAEEAVVEPTNKSAYSITADFPYASKYVFRGIQYAKDSFQPSVKLSAGDGYLGIWANQPLDNEFDSEIDLFAGYNFQLEGGWSFDVGGTLYWYPETDSNSDADESTFEAYAGLNGTIDGVSVSLYAYHDFTLDVTTVQGGLGYSFPLSEKVDCNLSANVGHASPDEGDSYTYYTFGVQLPYKLSEKATVTIGGNFASHDLSGVKDDHFWLNAGFTYEF